MAGAIWLSTPHTDYVGCIMIERAKQDRAARL